MQSQLEWIKAKLIVNGQISRNECLANYISRLSGRILDLRKAGWEFRTETIKENGGKNFYYYVLTSPLKKTIYTVQGMENKEITVYN